MISVFYCTLKKQKACCSSPECAQRQQKAYQRKPQSMEKESHCFLFRLCSGLSLVLWLHSKRYIKQILISLQKIKMAVCGQVIIQISFFVIFLNWNNFPNIKKQSVLWFSCVSFGPARSKLSVNICCVTWGLILCCFSWAFLWSFVCLMHRPWQCQYWQY